MSAIGARNEVINASQVFLKLGGNTHILLQDLEFVIDRFEDREDVSTGAIYFYSQHHNQFDATLLLSAPEVDAYLDKTDFAANDFLTTQAYAIEYVPLSGASQTITVTALTPYCSFVKLPTGGVRARMRFRITEDVTSADVT